MERYRKIVFVFILGIQAFIIFFWGDRLHKPRYNELSRIDTLSQCNFYKTVEEMTRAFLQRSSVRCAVVRHSYNNDSQLESKVVFLKATTHIKDFQTYSEGLRTFDSYVEVNKMAIIFYFGLINDWPQTIAPHFVKIKAIEFAFSLGYEWVVFSDMDSFVPKATSIDLRSYLVNVPTNVSLILQRETVICSCFHIWRYGMWSMEFLRRWWEAGSTSSCCKYHSFDQIAFWGTLLGLSPTSLSQNNWPDYCSAINNGFANYSVLLSDEALHSAPWNDVLEHTSLMRHTGSVNWATHGLVRIGS